jgi:tRNA U34 2-thiouridine synthase MnmA/TrmU
MEYINSIKRKALISLSVKNYSIVETLYRQLLVYIRDKLDVDLELVRIHSEYQKVVELLNTCLMKQGKDAEPDITCIEPDEIW